MVYTSSFEKTLLWTNPDPEGGWSDFTVSLPYYADYDFIEIEYNDTSYISRDGVITLQAILPIHNFTILGRGSRMNTTIGCIGADSNILSRMVWSPDDTYTKISFTVAYRLGTSGGRSDSVVPINIYGIVVS